MDDAAMHAIADWVTGSGLAGMEETALVRGFCERCVASGMRLSRGLVFLDTLHPVHEGRAFRWRNDGVVEDSLVEYGRTDSGAAADEWMGSPFHHLVTTGEVALRRRIGPAERCDFRLLERLREQGATDYLACVHRFGADAVIGEMDCVYSHWISTDPSGFGEAELAALRRLVPPLALAVKAGALARIAGTLVEVYLGRDPGRRVLSGRIRRGVADRIRAALWYSDLRGFTTISDRTAPEEIIPLLNDYADPVVSAIHDAGGDVLKLVGDGTLAVFAAADTALACRAALKAEAKLRHRLAAVTARRAAEGRPVTTVYLGLHVGEVFYGNIGSEERLDFTVVGPAVNEVARIATMCRAVDRAMVASADFAAALPEPDRQTLVSVGRFALRGVGRAQELFTLDPALAQ